MVKNNFELQFTCTASCNEHTFCVHMAHYGQIHIIDRFGALGGKLCEHIDGIVHVGPTRCQEACAVNILDQGETKIGML